MKYRTVTVSGEIASGTTTLARGLAIRLGWEYINMGEYFRQYCREHNLPLQETEWQNDEVHLKMDRRLRWKLSNGVKNLIAEGWLAGFMAQGIAGVLKVLLVAPLRVRVERFMKRERVSEVEARLHIQRRTEENVKKWRRIYAKGQKIDFFGADLYDVVIDTSRVSELETLDEISLKLEG